MEQKKWNRNDRRPPARRAQEPAEAAENMLEGRNAVQEALAAGRPIDKLYIAAGETDRAPCTAGLHGKGSRSRRRGNRPAQA